MRNESEQRSAILEASIPVFAEQGLKGATTRRLADAAGVNNALLYYYFENKHSLFVEAVRFIMKGFMAHLARRHIPFRNARDRLDYLVQGVFEYFSSHPERTQLMTLSIALHADLLGEVFGSLAREQAILPLKVLGEGMEKGELRAMSPLQAWWCLLGMCIFSLNAQKVLPYIQKQQVPMEIPGFDERREQILTILTEGLARPPAGSSRARKGGKRK